MIETSAAEKIALFLDRYPGGKLRIAVAYATVWGLAWLHRNTEGRPVDIVVGDCRPQFFAKFSEADGEAACEFLARSDVRLMNLYSRRNRRSVHAKIWMLEDQNGNSKILAGSANLTKQGMLYNTENMGEYDSEHATQTRRQVKTLFAEAWDAKGRVRGYIEENRQPVSVPAAMEPAVPPAFREPEPAVFREPELPRREVLQPAPAMARRHVKDHSVKAFVMSLVGLFLCWPLGILGYVLAARTARHHRTGTLPRNTPTAGLVIPAKVLGVLCMVALAWFLIWIAATAVSAS